MNQTLAPHSDPIDADRLADEDAQNRQADRLADEVFRGEENAEKTGGLVARFVACTTINQRLSHP